VPQPGTSRRPPAPSERLHCLALPKLLAARPNCNNRRLVRPNVPCRGCKPCPPIPRTVLS
jgi:hypothetical protein